MCEYVYLIIFIFVWMKNINKLSRLLFESFKQCIRNIIHMGYISLYNYCEIKIIFLFVNRHSISCSTKHYFLRFIASGGGDKFKKKKCLYRAFYYRRMRTKAQKNYV